MKLLLLIGAAGFAGSLLRYGFVRLAEHFLPGFPWGTLLVNLLGSGCAGFCFVLLRQKFPQLEPWFPVVFVGFLGAFTTFSTFALESTRLLLDAAYLKFAANLLLHVICGIGAAAAGMWLVRLLR